MINMYKFRFVNKKQFRLFLDKEFFPPTFEFLPNESKMCLDRQYFQQSTCTDVEKKI